ncbi:MAG: hypothetical protein HYZ45_07255 [Burkholderiales bacterium]|nr:hypothetical protein [Burkholderiales bacterium]
MADTTTIHWELVLRTVKSRLNSYFNLTIAIDQDIIDEISFRLWSSGYAVNDKESIVNATSIELVSFTGQIAFWIQKLKPLNIVHVPPGSTKILNINELAAVLLAEAICFIKVKKSKFPPQLIAPWADSLRSDIHSPQSCATTLHALTI